jgi:hypothetical protein
VPEFDGVRGAGNLRTEFFDFVPVAPAAVDAQRYGTSVAALAFVVARLGEAADLEPAPS